MCAYCPLSGRPSCTTMVLATPPEHPSRLRIEDGIYLSDGRHEKPTTSRPQEPTLQREGSARELPEAVKNLVEARTGDAVYVVDPDYRSVQWFSEMDALSLMRSQYARVHQ